jgi:hypothetical protein
MAAKPLARLLGVGQWQVSRAEMRIVGFAPPRTSAATSVTAALVALGRLGVRFGPPHQQRGQQHQYRQHEQRHDRDQTPNLVRLTSDASRVPRLGAPLQCLLGGSARRRRLKEGWDE